uniref:Ig-like domain-containing protein n=1 Tax=Oreochromis aureus TaxID=47969 RepID=A0A668SJV2_OREAU
VMFSLIFLTGSSLSDRVHQDPANMYKNQGETAEITCSHSIDNYDQILWYKKTKSSQLQLLGYMFGTSKSREPGVTVTIGGNANKDKNCTLTINDLFMNSSVVYFCAARYHSATYH